MLLNKKTIEINFIEPVNIADARNRRLSIIETIQSIELQLTQVREEIEAGHKTEDLNWRHRTKWALFFKNAEKRRLESWINDRLHQEEHPAQILLQDAHNLLTDLQADKVHFNSGECDLIKQINIQIKG